MPPGNLPYVFTVLVLAVGWSSAQVEFACRTDPCLNGGTCVGEDFENYICNCTAGFAGARCELDVLACYSNPCLNGGSCIDEDFENYICNCMAGFAGPNCEIALVDPCMSSPCENGGVCFTRAFTRDSYVCVCIGRFTGINCELIMVELACLSNPCLNGGSCIDKDFENYICNCTAGFAGPNCELVELACHNRPNPCLNGGSCIDKDFENYICNCTAGFAGPNCELECNCHTDSAGRPKYCEVSAECDVTDILEVLVQVAVTESNVLPVSTALRNVSSSFSDEDEEEDVLAQTAMILENIANVTSPSLRVTINVVETVDNLLNLPDAVFEKSGDAAGRVLRSFEAQLTQVGENLTATGGRLANLAVDVVLGGPQFDAGAGIGYASTARGGVVGALPPAGSQGLQPGAEASIGLPGEALDLAYEGEPGFAGGLRIVFATYRTPKLFQPARMGALSFPDGRMLKVNSQVISAIVGSPDRIIANLSSPVVTSFLSPSTAGERVCVFWDVAARNWSTEGCTRSTARERGSDAVACDCDHLTNFAVLLSFYGDDGNFALDIVSKVGCCVSIVFLALTIMTCLVNRELRNNPAKKSLICLCASLLALYTAFLAGIDQAPAGPVACAVAAALIQYFFLTSVCWSSGEALNLFYLLVITRRELMTSYLLKQLLFCWGVPMVIVAGTFLVPYLATGRWELEGEYCFLTPGVALYVGVHLPVALMLIFNALVLALLVRRLACQRVESSRTRRESKAQAALRHGRLMLPIALLLGATWLVGFAAVPATRGLGFQWVFAVLNSLLGLHLFLLFIAGRPAGRRGLARLLCVQQIRKMTSTQSSAAAAAGGSGSTPHGTAGSSS